MSDASFENEWTMKLGPISLKNNKAIEVFTAFFFTIVNMVCCDWCVLKVMSGPFKTDVALITTCFHNKL